MRYVLLKAKSPMEDSDGALTPAGIQTVNRYAQDWVARHARNMDLELRYPELKGVFYDVRHDPALAQEYVGKSIVQNQPQHFVLAKAGGPYIGPRGGKWADPDHTISWNPDEATARHPAKGEEVKPEGKPTTGGKPEAAGKPGVGAEQGTEGKPGAAAQPGGMPTRTWVEDHPHYKGGRQTIDNYRVSGEADIPPIYHADRQALHDKIVASFLNDKAGRPIQPPPANVKKTVVLMMGGPASGKTSTVKTLLGVPDGDFASKGFVNVNPDDVKEHLPEYREALNLKIGDKLVSAKNAGSIVHEESADVAGQVQRLAMDKGLNLVIDGTGKNAEKYARLIGQLQSKGYHVQLVMPHLDKNEAIRRAKQRAEHSGRQVPDALMHEAYSKVPPNFERLARQADEFHLFDTGGTDGKAVLKWSGQKGQQDIEHDPRFVHQFKEHVRSLGAATKEPMGKSERFIISKGFPPKNQAMGTPQPPRGPPPGGPQPTQGPPQGGPQSPKFTIPGKPQALPPQSETPGGQKTPQNAPQQPQSKPPMPAPSPTDVQAPGGQPGVPGQPPSGERPAITMDEIIANTKKYAVKEYEGEPKFPGAGTKPGVGVEWPMWEPNPDPQHIVYRDPKAGKVGKEKPGESEQPEKPEVPVAKK
jgi:predicted ABC-type ATPase